MVVLDDAEPDVQVAKYDKDPDDSVGMPWPRQAGFLACCLSLHSHEK